MSFPNFSKFSGAAALPIRSARGFSARGFAVLIGAGALAGLLVLFILTLNTAASADRRVGAEARQIQTLRIFLVSGELEAAANEALRGERGFLLTGEERFLQPYQKAQADMPRLTARLAEMTSDNAEQRRRLIALRRDLNHYFRILERGITIMNQEGQPAAIAFVRSGTGRQAVQAVLQSLERIEAEERHTLARYSTEGRRAAVGKERFSYALAALGALLLIVATAAAAVALNAFAVKNRAIEELRRLSSTDDLTGLANRRRFFAQLEAERARARRQGLPLAVALLDLDHFKSVNDRYGHPAGDAVLRKVAATLLTATRTEDLVARIGGEEFAVLMPGTDEAQARTACERFRKRVAAVTIHLPGGQELSATTSAGAACASGDEGVDTLLLRADHALYEAKLGGRNCLKMAA